MKTLGEIYHKCKTIENFTEELTYVYYNKLQELFK